MYYVFISYHKYDKLMLFPRENADMSNEKGF